MLQDTLTRNYRNPVWLWPYWSLWVIITLMIVFSHVREEPHLVRICIHLIIIRNIIPWFNMEDRVKFDDMGNLILFNQLQVMGLVAVMVPMCLFESPLFHVPISVVYQISFSYG